METNGIGYSAENRWPFFHAGTLARTASISMVLCRSVFNYVFAEQRTASSEYSLSVSRAGATMIDINDESMV